MLNRVYRVSVQTPYPVLGLAAIIALAGVLYFVQLGRDALQLHSQANATAAAMLQLQAARYEIQVNDAASKARSRSVFDKVRSETGLQESASMVSVLNDYQMRQKARAEMIEEDIKALFKNGAFVFALWLTALSALAVGYILYLYRGKDAQQKKIDRLISAVNHDPLTGLPNRRYLHDWLNKAVNRGIRHSDPVSVLYIDLDGFSDINNTFGHEAGDKTLCWAANTMKSTLRGSDFLCRLGGDEFVVVSASHTIAEMEQLATRLLTRFQQSTPFPDTENGCIGLSIGIAAMPLHGTTSASLLKRADAAMYEAKAAGKRCYRVAQATPQSYEAARWEQTQQQHVLQVLRSRRLDAAS